MLERLLLKHLTKKGKIRVEYYTDSLTIAAGFGEQLFQWAAYVLYDSDASEEYKAFKSEIWIKKSRGNNPRPRAFTKQKAGIDA